jgi:hypothetical protein
MAGAPKGNKNALKLKTPDLKAEAYKQYCAHLAKGKSKKSWYFEHPDLELTAETMDKYIAENPIDFRPITKQIAEIKGFAHWEEIVEQSARGENEANTASLQMLMRNKYKWDKETIDRATTCSADEVLQMIRARTGPSSKKEEE